MAFFEHLLHLVIEWAIIGFEFVGVLVLIWAGVKNLVRYIKKDIRSSMKLGKGIAMGLEFMMIGEILRTITTHDISEIIGVAAIVVIRVVLTILIHWEIKEEEKEIEHEEAKHSNHH
jgi:uncharacterized membrane protein